MMEKKPSPSFLSSLSSKRINFLVIVTVWMAEMLVAQNTSIVPVKVGVVLDMDRDIGKFGLTCISMALSDLYSSHAHYKTRVVLHTRNSNDSVVAAASAAQDLLKNVEVQAIIGPVTSMQASFMISLGDEAQVPVVSFSATSPSLASLRSSYFIRATLSDSSQVKSISALVQAFGWRAAVPIYVDNEFGEGIIPFLTDALQEVDARVPYRSVIHPLASDAEIAAELYKLMTMQTRVFIVHMSLSLSVRLFDKVKEIGMMSEGYVWIITDGMTNPLSLNDPSDMKSMQGVIAVKPHVPKSKKLDDFTVRWKRNFQANNLTVPDLTIFGLWAYDATIALAMAVEKATINSPNSKDLGKHIQQVLSTTKFNGLSGDFRIVNGQLQAPAFQIVNYQGGERVIGFWTAENGIVKELDVKRSNSYSTSKANLEAVVWPGESTSIPKGWVIPTNGKKLRIGVPVKDGNSKFVMLRSNSARNSTMVTGFCIDVFEAVMSSLPYAVPYEYIPFASPSGRSAGSYNDLVYQVFLGNFDAVVGDVTIIANRSFYVDFTLPYTESGVTMIVPVKDKKAKNAWVFSKPLTWDLWLASTCFFIYIGIVIWVIEQTNQDLGENSAERFGTSLWFSFSTMVFAHREKVVSGWARFVVIIWCFVVLVLTQSYTASLTSLLTVQQLVPTVTTLQEIKDKGEIVGYPKDSFVIQLLKQKNISQLHMYNSTDELDTLFSKGSKNGGIAAAFDEVPYMKPFLSKYCSKYTMVGPLLRTDGFGFVFPIGSPLVPDVSRAVLTVTEGDKMEQIEKAWFGNQKECPDPSTSVSATSLGLNSFWGLFLIVGLSSAFPLFRFASKYAILGTLWDNVASIFGTNADATSNPGSNTADGNGESLNNNSVYQITEEQAPLSSSGHQDDQDDQIQHEPVGELVSINNDNEIVNRMCT